MGAYKLLSFLFLTSLFIGCGKKSPNEVLETSIVVNNPIEKPSESSAELVNSVDAKKNINLDLDQLRNQIIDASEVSIGNSIDNAFSPEAPLDGIDVNVESSSDIEVGFDESTSSLEKNPNTGDTVGNLNNDEGPTDEEGYDVASPDLDSLDDNLRFVSENGTSGQYLVDQIGNNLGSKNQDSENTLDEENTGQYKDIPDLTGSYAVSDISLGKYFLYDESMCVISSMVTALGRVPRVFCTPIVGADSTVESNDESPCLHDGQIYEHGQKWSKEEVVKVFNGKRNIHDTPIYDFEIQNIVLECDNGEINIIK